MFLLVVVAAPEQLEVAVEVATIVAVVVEVVLEVAVA